MGGPFKSTVLIVQIPPVHEHDNFNCTQKSHQILVLRLLSVLHKSLKTIGCRHSKGLELFFSQNHVAFSLRISLLKSRILTPQSALKQAMQKKRNCQNNNDRAKKLTLSSHLISVNYCSIFTYFTKRPP